MTQGAGLHGLQAGWRGWPRRLPAQDALPPTLPDGRPWPRISIVTPTLNQGPYIEDCILSVLHQGYPDIEHIVIDGGSTDGTDAVLDRYAARLTHLVREPDEGQSDAINKGMALTTGSILTWLNSDDMLAPGALAAAARALASSGADMIAGACSVLYGRTPASHHLPSVPNGPLPLDQLVDIETGWLRGRFFYQPEVLFTRDLWARAGGHVRKDLHYSMDYDMWVRFAEVGATLHTIGQPLCVFRHTAEQKTANKADYMPELGRTADQAARRNAIIPGQTTSTAPLGRNLRIVTLHVAAPEARATPLSRLAEACHDAWAEVVPIQLTAGDAPASLAPQIGHILSRIGWQGPDMVLVEDLRGVPGGDALLDAVATRWPTLTFLDGAGWPTRVPDDLVGVIDLRGDALRPAIPRRTLLSPPDPAAARGGLRLPGDAFCVLLLGAEAQPGEAAALIAAVADAAPDVVVRTDATVGPQRAAVLSAFDAVVALGAEADGVQALAEAAGCGCVPLSLGPTALHHGTNWPPELAPCATVAEAAERLAALAADPSATAWLGTHARQIALAEFSTFAAYRALFLLWRDCGLIDRLGAKDKIDFRPEPTPLPASLRGWPGL